MAARRALEWIGCIFRYEVFPQVSRGETSHIAWIFNEIQQRALKRILIRAELKAWRRCFPNGTMICVASMENSG